MTFPRKIAIVLLLAVFFSALGQLYDLQLPTLRWFFSFEFDSSSEGSRINWSVITGYALLTLVTVIAIGCWIAGKNFEWNPMTARRFKRFRSLSRGYRSFIILVVILLTTIPDQALVGKKALAVKYNGSWYFPAFVTKNYTDDAFGGVPKQNANYREIKKRFQAEKKGNFAIMPIVPWDTTFDTDELQKVSLANRDGVYYEQNSNKAYQGLATSYFPNSPTIQQKESTFRKGKLQGSTTVFSDKGEPLAKETWREGVLEKREIYDKSADEIQFSGPSDYYALKYPPVAPSWKNHHILGTDSRGWDLFAQLYGGLQVVCKASAFYVFLTFAIGIVTGLASGYFGGVFDLIMQRMIEILSNIPFLFVVMIIASRIGRENVSIISIVAVMSIFSWIGISLYKRTAAYKDKARDYVAAARVLGAGTLRIIFRHILPNVLSTSITLVPFTVTAVATSLTSLDFIGFGLPDRYPSWGTLLADGLANLEAPWIVSSVFVILAVTLLLITFVGEAIREAFDPKKFTTYS
jgi:microcin C transport system permease protein